MSTDTPSGESNASLSVRDAAALFSAEPEQQQPEAKAADTAKGDDDIALVKSVLTDDPEATKADADPAKVDAAPPSDETITIEVDGKAVEIKKSELPDIYKNGLRQADYTKKTMEASEQRKTAEAEIAKAREERQKYAQGLSQAQTLVQAQLQEQSKIDWHGLRETDPTEFLKQWHLYTERQASLQRIVHEQQQINAKAEAEQAEHVKSLLKEQQEQLLAKLPEWKDEGKAKTEKAAIMDYLKSQGLEEAQINNITDHRVVILSRKAMLYDQMMSKASAAAKKVENLPKTVAKPGGGEISPTDGRTAAMKRLSQTGSVRDAAEVFAKFF